MTPLSMEDTFQFSCSRQVACYNQCCRDLNQFITPYDILRLKQRLGLPSYHFLERYTSQHIGPATGLPVITLKPNVAAELNCPFVTTTGCSVYADRPSSCRMYPLVRIASKTRPTGTLTERYSLLQEPHCLGFKQARTHTVQKWIKDQGLTVYNQLNDMFMEIISLKNRLLPGPMDVKAKMLFNLACYDLDAFREHIFDQGLLHNYRLDESGWQKIKASDVELLKLGFNWIRDTLFENGN